MNSIKQRGTLKVIGTLMVALFAFLFESNAQQSNIEGRLISMLEKFKQHENERLYVHTDRDLYVIGDTILVKATLFPKPSPKIADGDSRFVYLDLVNSDGKVMNREKIIIDLSSDFQYGGGTESQYVRLNQLIKTVFMIVTN